MSAVKRTPVIQFEALFQKEPKGTGEYGIPDKFLLNVNPKRFQYANLLDFSVTLSEAGNEMYIPIMFSYGVF
jgi:hypothetical protein